MKKLFLILLTFISVNAKVEEEIEPLKEGNLSLPPSQQILPLFAFGQNIIQKGAFLVECYLDYLKGKDKKALAVIPSFLYAITDSCSVFMDFPIVVENKVDNKKSSGSGDFLIQFEYAIYNKSKLKYVNQITLVAAISYPTDSFFKFPSFTTGEPNFFIGTTASHVAIDWYYFASLGANFTKSKKCQNSSYEFGNQYLYQAGFGRNIFASDGWICTWLLEFDGNYTKNNFFNNKKDLNSGGNYVFISPSLYLANESFYIQGGFGFPIIQNLNGNQKKIDFIVSFDAVYTFGT